MVHRFYTIRTLFLCLSCSVCLLFACQSEKPTTVATTETTEKTETVAETLTAVEETAPVAEAKSAPIASTTNTEKPVVKVVEASVGATKTIDTKAVAAKVATSSTAIKPTPSKTPPAPTTTVKSSLIAEKTVTEPEVNYKGEAKPAAASKGAAITFEEPTYEFGTILIGTIIEHDFKFTNTGSIPLIIKDASSTCGCTIPEIPNAPIMPGQSSKIHVVFDSKGKIGTQNKVVTVYTNAGTREITMKGVGLTANLMKKDGEEEKK